MKKEFFDLISKVTYAIGTFHSMLDQQILPTILRDIETTNKRQFHKKATGFLIFKSLYMPEIKKDNPGKKRGELYQILNNIWNVEFDEEMREKFEDIARVEDVITHEAKYEIKNEKVNEKGNKKVKRRSITKKTE